MREQVDALEINVGHKRGDLWPIVVEWRRSGALGTVHGEDVLRLSGAQQAELTSLLFDPLPYGTILGKALFSGDRGNVRDLFNRALGASVDRLRVLLHIEDAELKRLHWERLCYRVADEEWDFLALDQRLPFSLYVPTKTDRRFPAIGRGDLRALLLVARPQGLAYYGMDEFDAAATVASVTGALGPIPCDVLATVDGAAGPPTLDKLCERITEEYYPLLHVVAHGQVRAGESVVYLADDRNQVAPVKGQTLITRLRRLQGAGGLPHFAFLATCESAKPEAGLGGLAQRLVENLGLPAVLAMTEKVTIPTAGALAARFYQQLLEHGEPDRARAEACAGLARAGDIVVPVLYSRLGGLPLFSEGKEGVPVEDTSIPQVVGTAGGPTGALEIVRDDVELVSPARGEVPPQRPKKAMPDYDHDHYLDRVAAIRNLMRDVFTAQELRRFILDRPEFRPVDGHFGPNSSLEDMIDAVIDYCRTQVLFAELLAEIRELNPRQFSRHKAQIFA
jgi:hypothetical protein